MIQLNCKQDCVGCGNCANICPKQCITMKPDNEGFLYPSIKEDDCIQCNQCNKVCPVIQKVNLSHKEPIRVLGANHKDTNFRMQSSSGGVFGEIVKYCINLGGIVWGATWISKHEVEHIYITKFSDLWKLQKSKYVQSNITNAFPIIKKQLTNSPLVLFSGTPCQIKALYDFLKYRPINLLTIEVVCHGVPSPLILKKYLIEKEYTSFDFRDKENSWSNYSVKLIDKNGTPIKEKASNNIYMKGFLKELFIRPSCEKCPGKSFKSGADFTLGDFWGVNTYLPELFDDIGTSIVFIHTQNGEEIWNKIKSQFRYKNTTLNNALIYNPSIIDSIKHSTNRNRFFKESEKSVTNALIKYSRDKISLKNYLKQKLLLLWNFLWIIYKKCKYSLFSIYDKIYKTFHQEPAIKSLEETLLYILEHKCSVSRYGDGEMKFVFGNATWFQKSNVTLNKRLTELLIQEIPNHIVCIPPIFNNLGIYQSQDKLYWKNYIIYNRSKWYQYLNPQRIYYDAFISRCYMPYKNKNDVLYWFELWKKIWDQKDILIIEGEKTRLGVNNDLFNNVKSVKRILCPNTNAFDYYDNIIEETKKYSPHHLILLALGPTATILAADLALLGYQAIDIGHIDIEYEWYLMKADHKVPVPYKFVNEAGAGKGVGDIDNEKYKSEIVCQF